MNVPARTIAQGDVIESVITKGDLGRLSPEERAQYYVQLCNSMGLNPYTQPFSYIPLNGKLTLYAKRDAADQLRKINGISIEIIEKLFDDGLLTVHVRAKDRDGRVDEDFGVVAMPDTLKGEMRANAILKCVTKAKRRVTLSISGLGFLDETEIEDIPKQTARARNADIAKLPDDEREEATERAHEEWGDKQGAALLGGMKHDANGEVWEEDGVRPATAADFKEEADHVPSKNMFLHATREHIRTATDASELDAWWHNPEKERQCRDFALTRGEFRTLNDFAEGRIAALKQQSINTGK